MGHEQPGEVFPYAETPHHPVTRPGCEGMSLVRIFEDRGADLHVVELAWEAGGEMDEHAADHPILLIVTRGGGEVRTDGVESPIRAGECVYWAPGAMHHVRAGDAGMAAIVVEYEPPSAAPG